MLLQSTMAGMRFLLFGDQSSFDRAHIHKQVVESRENPFLSLFYRKTSDALRHEIAQLSPLERIVVPTFTTIAELNDRTTSKDAHEGVQNALQCISQLAHYIE